MGRVHFIFANRRGREKVRKLTCAKSIESMWPKSGGKPRVAKGSFVGQMWPALQWDHRIDRLVDKNP